MKLMLLIPAYNEEANIERVVREIIDHYPQYDYVVVNDGSKDRTAEICRSNHFNLLDLPVNLGLSGAFQAGMRYAWEQGYDAVLQFDGDGQHDAAFIGVMEKAMEQEHCDIVIGSRFVTEPKPMTSRMLGSRLLSHGMKLTTGKKLTDPTSGMRLFSRKMIRQFAMGMNYGPEPDTIAYLIRGGAKVTEVQVEMHERIAGTSYLNLSRSILYMLNMLCSIFVFQFARKKEG